MKSSVWQTHCTHLWKISKTMHISFSSREHGLQKLQANSLQAGELWDWVIQDTWKITAQGVTPSHSIHVGTATRGICRDGEVLAEASWGLLAVAWEAAKSPEVITLPYTILRSAILTKVKVQNKVPSSTGRELRLQESPQSAGYVAGFKTEPARTVSKLNNCSSWLLGDSQKELQRGGTLTQVSWEIKAASGVQAVKGLMVGGGSPSLARESPSTSRVQLLFVSPAPSIRCP
jgi:hypothetical protein